MKTKRLTMSSIVMVAVAATVVGCASPAQPTAETTVVSADAPTGPVETPGATPTLPEPETSSVADDTAAPGTDTTGQTEAQGADPLLVPSAADPARGRGGRTPSTPAPAASGWWQPSVGSAWQIQLAGTVDLSITAPIYDIDGVETSAEAVATIHSRGAMAICYVSAGSIENWRSDASAFPSSVIGRRMDGWAGESWLDVRNLDVLIPIMAARADACKAKGFDAIDWDNVDGYMNNTGFPLTDEDQRAYNAELALLTHERGMAVGLKNDSEQVSALVSYFDFAVVESCLEYNECALYQPFIAAGKPVFHIEYRNDLRFCTDRSIEGFSSVAKDDNLNAPLRACS